MSEPGEEERVGRRADDVSWPLVEHRLTTVERGLKDDFRHLNTKIDGLNTKIDGLADVFVRRGEYEADTRTHEAVHQAMRDDISDARRIATWAVSGIGLALLGGVVAAIARLAGLS